MGSAPAAFHDSSPGAHMAPRGPSEIGWLASGCAIEVRTRPLPLIEGFAPHAQRLDRPCHHSIGGGQRGHAGGLHHA